MLLLSHSYNNNYPKGVRMKYVGAHVSIAGGVWNAPENAHALGATGFAMFTKNQRQWKAKDLTEEDIATFKETMDKYGYTADMVLPHDSYLINLGNPDEEKREKSYNAFVDELKRVAQLGLNRLNFHPGSHLKKITEEQCLDRIAESLNRALSETEGVIAVIENTAGQGTNLGYTIDHLAHIINKIEDKSRIGICIDTCHTFASGYDLREPEQVVAFFNEVDEKIGLEYIKGFHLNGSKSEFASKVDRHHSLEQGNLGLAVFKHIMKEPRFEKIPMVLETIDDTIWPEEIELLKSFQ